MIRRAANPLLALVPLALALACAPDGGSRLELQVVYHDPSRHIWVGTSRALGPDESLYADLRRGSVGELDCATDLGDLTRIDGRRIEGSRPIYEGPPVEPFMLENQYDTSWLEMAEPTPEMLASVAEGEWMVDVCLMGPDGVVRELEMDLRRALDRKGSNGKFDGEEARVASTTAYAELCVDQLGEIPFFEKLADGDYATFNCLDATAIPTTVTAEDGSVEYPSEEVSQCDEPQYIYSLCEPNAVDGRTNGPRVTSQRNEQGTHWVLLCRKAKEEEGSYNDIAMIGHNPFTGRTCFFQNALYSRTDGLHVPHPGDKVESEPSPQQSASLWSGIHGGLGSGIECAECHDSDPFIHTPWIDRALREDGTPVVPRMGDHADYQIGFNDAPYYIVNTQGQGWEMPRQLVSPEANACTECHRIGNGRWTDSWIRRLRGTDTAWANKVTESHRDFEDVFWMPPDLEGLTAETFPESEFGLAMEFIEQCGNDPESCEWADLPKGEGEGGGELPTIDLEGDELAKSALIALGADVEDESCPDGQCATRRCAECHSVSRSGLRRWLDDTERAWRDCDLDANPDEMSQEDARRAVDCMRVVPEDPESVFAAERLGILVTGVQYAQFRDLFQKAYGDAWLPEYAQFKARVGMPKGNYAELTPTEFATVLKWFQNDLDGLDAVLQEPPPPATCEESFDATAIAAHVTDMRYEGWGAVNAENGIRMYGCSGEDALECFSTGFDDRSRDWGAGSGTIRDLGELGFRTSFWTRSSADGRFVGNGGGSSAGATITDLATGMDIAVDASYDPGFFPDNSGFIFQGGGGGAGICAQSLLERDNDITFDEPECIRASGINLYQHVARGLGGGDYFIINSQFTSDAGGSSTDPSAHFNGSSTMKFTPMIFDGTRYEPMRSIIVDSPYEGDSVLSPSSRLVGSRLSGPEGRSLGYVVRRVNAQRFGESYRIDLSEPLATVCMSGAKMSFSFDERFFVTHHYENGTANIYLVDMQTAERHQITNMPEGTRALFPHFRSDGWFYFLVKGADEEWMAASDAAIRLSR